MRFEYPELIWLVLLAVPALSAFFWWSWRKRCRLIGQFVQSRLLAALTVGVSAARQKARLCLLVASVGLVIFVLARPQWGYDWEEARQRGLDIVVAIDTSRSMLADDIKPNRLERAKLAAIDLKRLSRADRMGLVAFAGSAFLQCPLTLDDEPFRQSVNALDVSIIPQGGTALAEAIGCALGAFKEKTDNHRVVVLFSDGEDHDGNALEAAQAAAKDGFRFFTIGVGTPSGELLRATDAKGRVDYIKDDQGNVVKSRLNETLLRQIAQAGSGFYMQLAGADTMDVLYERGLAPLPKAEFSARRVQRWHERYQGFLGLAMLLLLAEVFLPERKQVRRADEVVGAGSEALRKVVAVFLALLLLPSGAFGSASARKKYDSRRYASALLEYQKLLKEKPNDPRLHFNAGASAYQVQDFEEALKQFNDALVTPDVSLQQRAYYNLGNTQFRIGEEEQDPSKKVQAWSEATNHFDNALKLNPKDADARHNLDYVTRMIEALPKPPPQQSRDNKDDKDKQDDQKQDQKQDQQQQQQDQSKQNQSKEDQSKQDQQQQQQGEQQPAERPQQKEQQAQSGNKQDDQKDGEAQKAVMARMTPQQAAQLLESVKSDEKMMPFHLQLRSNKVDRLFRDW